MRTPTLPRTCVALAAAIMSVTGATPVVAVQADLPVAEAFAPGPHHPDSGLVEGLHIGQGSCADSLVDYERRHVEMLERDGGGSTDSPVWHHLDADLVEGLHIGQGFCADSRLDHEQRHVEMAETQGRGMADAPVWHHDGAPAPQRDDAPAWHHEDAPDRQRDDAPAWHPDGAPGAGHDERPADHHGATGRHG